MLFIFTSGVQAKQSQIAPEYQLAVEEIVGLWNQHAYEEYTDMLNISAISRLALKEFEFTKQQKLEFIKGFRIGIRQAVKVTFNQISETGYVLLLKSTPTKNGVKALIRVDFGENGLGYLELYLRKNSKGTIKIIDWYDYAQGRNVSDSLRQLIITSLPPNTVVDRAFNIINGKEVVRRQLTAMLKLLQENKINEFDGLYQSLGKDAKENKSLMVLAVNMANLSQNEKLYRKTLDDLYQYHGDDPSMSFLLIDHLFYQQEYDAAIESINLFQKSIGVEDAGLMMLKSNMLTMKGNPDAGAKLAARATVQEPEYEDAYWSLFFALAKDEQYEQAVKTATLLEDKFGYRLDNAALAEDESYDGLRESPVFKQWRTSRQ